MCKKSTIKQVNYRKTYCLHCGREIVTFGNRGNRYCWRCAIEAEHYYRHRGTIAIAQWQEAQVQGDVS